MALRAHQLGLLAAVVAVSAACGNDTTTPLAGVGGNTTTSSGQGANNNPLLAVGDTPPDFSVLDVNSTSDTFDTMVSVGQFEGQVSAWYFGHAT